MLPPKRFGFSLKQAISRFVVERSEGQRISDTGSRRGASRRSNFVMILPLLAGLCACSTSRPPSTSCPVPEMARSETGTETAAVTLYGQGFVKNLTDRAAENPVRPVEINAITLSAGGQWGAFGAGLISGWADRPDFDLVTGVSTGALISVPTFAGTAQNDILALYDGLEDDDVITRNPLFGLLGAPAAASTAPLERRLRAELTPEVMDAVAARHAEGHRLVVGATNIDTTRFETFDLGAVADHPGLSESQKQDCLTEALLASAAIPVAMPPRHINGSLFADGGLRDQVFFREIERARAEVQRSLNRPVRVNAYVVVNGQLTPPTEKVDDSIVNYAVRSIGALTDEILRDSIFETVEFAEDRGNWRLRGIVPRIDADALDAACGFREPASFEFNACFTSYLFDQGRRMGTSGQIPWLEADALRDLALEF